MRRSFNIRIAFVFFIRNAIVTASDITSATTMESQIPSSFQIIGSSSTAATWNTSVLRNEINADVSPSFNAVKNEEPKIENPENRNENEKIANACFVI